MMLGAIYKVRTQGMGEGGREWGSNWKRTSIALVMSFFC